MTKEHTADTYITSNQI